MEMSDTVDVINCSFPFTVYFSLENGLSDKKKTIRRQLSNMKGMFSDDFAFRKALKKENSLVYEFYALGVPKDAGDLALGTSITYPGKVGNEYYMTKGHFHTVLDTAEVYYCLKGHGYMMLENPEGEWDAQELTPGKAVYVPKRFAHRSVNVGAEPFVTFFVFRSDAGHDYRTIETKGFRRLIVEIEGRPAIVENPRWK